MNRWLQSKLYQCRCGEWFLHDRMFMHAVYYCPKRQPAGPVHSSGLLKAETGPPISVREPQSAK